MMFRTGWRDMPPRSSGNADFPVIHTRARALHAIARTVDHFAYKTWRGKHVYVTTMHRLLTGRLEDAHAAFECAVAVAPEDHAALRAQGRVAERLMVLRVALDPPATDEVAERELAHTDLDEMD